MQKKNASIHTDEFIIHTVGAIGKLKKKMFEKNVQVQLMSFYLINLETIEKCAYVKKNQFEKKVYNWVLLHTAEAMEKKCK